MRTALLENLLMLALGVVTVWAQANPASQPPAVNPPTAKSTAQGQHAPARTRGSAYLGVEIRDIPPERAAELKLKDGHGAEVVMVDQDASAGKAGLREGDIITRFNGNIVKNSAQLREMIRAKAPGTNVSITVIRDGEPETVKTTLGKRGSTHMAQGPNGPVRLGVSEIDIPPIPAAMIGLSGFHVLQYSLRNGVVIEDLTPQLAEYFGVHGGEGVLVRQVMHTTPAEAAGLKAGDVIVKAGNQRIRCSADWRRALHTKQPMLPVTVMRDHRAHTLSMNIPAPSDTMLLNMPDLNSEMQELEQHLQELGPAIEQDTRNAQIEMEHYLNEMEKAHRAHAAAIEKARHQTDQVEGAP